MLQGFLDEPEARLARLEKQRVKKTREGKAANLQQRHMRQSMLVV